MASFLRDQVDDWLANYRGGKPAGKQWGAVEDQLMLQQLAGYDGNIDGIISANDTMAGGIIARLKANGLAGKVPITGQDARVGGLQAILAGDQCMTVYKNTALEADLASKLAIDVIKGDKAAADALATGSVEDPTTHEQVKSALATPEAIYKNNIKKPFDDGFVTAADVCTGPYAKLCTQAGIS